MTDNEIIKALECCNGWDGRCLNCPLNREGTNCKEKLNSYALDLVNRQKEEIDRLNIESETLVIQLKVAYEQIHKLNMAKSEAIKECLAKVKNYIKTHCNPYGKPDFDYDTSIKILNFIDNILKENGGKRK